MDIIISNQLAGKSEEIFSLFEFGKIIVKDDKESLTAARIKIKEALTIIDYWLDRYK